MSTKAARGTKRVCQSCGSRFYDLNRDPIVCPVCSAALAVAGPAKAVAAPEVAEVEEVVAKPVAKPPVAKDVVVPPLAAEGEGLPEVVPDDELADIETEIEADVEIEGGAEEEDTFLEEEDDEGSDVADLIDSPIEEGGEEEV